MEDGGGHSRRPEESSLGRRQGGLCVAGGGGCVPEGLAREGGPGEAGACEMEKGLAHHSKEFVSPYRQQEALGSFEGEEQCSFVKRSLQAVRRADGAGRPAEISSGVPCSRYPRKTMSARAKRGAVGQSGRNP